jgi:hypothetical protein
MDVTCTVSTKGRLNSTLPLTLLSIANQILPPKELIIFMDEEVQDLSVLTIYDSIFKMIESKGIVWKILAGARKGQVANHQTALEIASCPYIWRIDDDCFADSNVLKNIMDHFSLFKTYKQYNVGAIGGLIIDPKNTKIKHTSSKIDHIFDRPNIQWSSVHTSDIYHVDHLYSSFVYLKEAGKHGYEKELSPVGHREETIFTYKMKRYKWDLIVCTNAITHHLRNPVGGIRENTDNKNFIHDDNIFIDKLNAWKINKEDYWIILDNGIGDHWAFKNVLNVIRNTFKDKNLIISCCYPEVFDYEPNITLASINDAIYVKGEDYLIAKNIYNFMAANAWKDNLESAYIKLYEQ